VPSVTGTYGHTSVAFVLLATTGVSNRSASTNSENFVGDLSGLPVIWYYEGGLITYFQAKNARTQEQPKFMSDKAEEKLNSRKFSLHRRPVVLLSECSITGRMTARDD
jgi:hypothetical protein